MSLTENQPVAARLPDKLSTPPEVLSVHGRKDNNILSKRRLLWKMGAMPTIAISCK